MNSRMNSCLIASIDLDYMGQRNKLLANSLIMVLLCLFISHKLSAQEENQKSILGMAVGMGYGKLRSNDLTDETFRFKPSYTKYAGFTLEIPIPKLEKKATFYNEMSFSQFEATSSTHFADTASGFPGRDYYDYKQTFAPNLISIANMFRFCFTNGDFKYYVSAGIYNSFVISPVNRKTIDHTVNGVVSTTQGDAVPKYAVHGLMIIAGTGITYKYIGLEIRFDPGRNYTNQIDYSVYSPTLSAMLQVRFNP